MTLSPYTKSQAVSAGFFELAGTENLLLHARYPGFLFRIVTTLDQAIACGACMVRTSESQISYFGLDLVYVVKGEKFGRYARPSTLRKSQNVLSPTTERYNGGASARTFSAGARFDMETSEWSEDPGDGKYIAIISRADRGMIVDREWKAAIPYLQITVPIVNGPIYDGTRQGKWVTYAGQRVATLRLASVSGFISNHIPLRKKLFLQQARAGFLNTIDADNKIVAAYTQAYDDYLATLKDEDMVVDSMTIYPYAESVGAPIFFTSERRSQAAWRFGDRAANMDRDPTNEEVALLAGPHTDFTMMKMDDVKGTMGANGVETWPPSVAPTDGGNRSLTVVVSIPHEQTLDGKPYPYWALVGVGSSTTESGQMPAPFEGTSRRVPTSGRKFPLDAVPFKSVRMIADAELHPSALYSAFGPRVRPDSLTEPTEVLDLSDRVNREVAAVAGLPALPNTPPPGLNDTEREIAATSVNTQMAAREAAILAACKHLTPFTAFITETVAAVTSRARQKLKA